MDHGVTLAVALLSLGEIQKTGMAFFTKEREWYVSLATARHVRRVFYRKMETATLIVRVNELCHRAKRTIVDRK